MSVEVVASQDDTTRMTVAGGLSMYEVAQIKTALDDVGLAHGRLILDLGAVDNCDSAGIQLLLQLRRRLQDRLTLECYPPAVMELLELYQLADRFGDQMVLPGR